MRECNPKGDVRYFSQTWKLVPTLPVVMLPDALDTRRGRRATLRGALALCAQAPAATVENCSETNVTGSLLNNQIRLIAI